MIQIIEKHLTDANGREFTQLVTVSWNIADDSTSSPLNYGEAV